jgi:hypothetical protein
MKFVVPAEKVHQTDNCKSCEAEVIWIDYTAKGSEFSKPHPVSVRTLTQRKDGSWEGDSHFSDCPNASRWRRR